MATAPPSSHAEYYVMRVHVHVSSKAKLTHNTFSIHAFRVSLVKRRPAAGRGRQVIAVCKSADLLLMVLDASKPHGHREILTHELEAVGVRLNRRPPSIYFKKKKTGGISFSSTLPLTRMDDKLCHRILQVLPPLAHMLPLKKTRRAASARPCRSHA